MDNDLIVNPEEYKLPEEKGHFVDADTQEIVESKDLTPFQVIKLLSQKMGITINDNPKKGCKKCYGRGYIGFVSGTPQPIACNCIFPTSAAKDSPNISMNREQKRKLQFLARKRLLKLKKEEQKSEQGS